MSPGLLLGLIGGLDIKTKDAASLVFIDKNDFISEA